ncbi:MAG: SAM-dependent DNA methyltransferase, partial [Deltaproteobacteria bacterium]|nr:SAM-dependent DNA methyltransferase [Deltaproteobacteria bacterium]
MLETAVREARDLAEAGARAVLEYLGVAQASPPEYLDGAQEALRERLRLHGRQLGDCLDGDAAQTTDRLAEEIAYEHWHRMLFARILAENGMLMYPSASGPVPVTLEDCADLAAEEGAADAWECAARYAAMMLPQIFRVGSPDFDVVFPPEHRQGLEKGIASLPPEIYAAQDTLGWVYQYWQSKRKDEVNASEVKIGARELPAVTQLFSPSYMVSFLLDNSLGAWWAARTLCESDLATAGSETELRGMASLPGVPLEYLRFVKYGDGPWTPATGTFDGWPDGLAEFRMLDPCCGSGHFLTAAFRMLVPMRMVAEGLSANAAVDAVLRDNIHGLELDRRCVELAAFALAMAAWTYPDAGGYRELPTLDLACSGTAVGADKDAWTELAGRDARLQTALALLYDAFRDAPVLGSLIDPRASADDDGLFGADWADVRPLLDKALAAEAAYERTEVAVAARGIAEAASLLGRPYTLVVTNVPYLSGGKHCLALKEFCQLYHTEAKGDLATAFIDRCLRLCSEGGAVAAVTPQNWLSLSSYTKFRVKLLKNDAWQMLARLGPGAFETISGEVVKVVLIAISRGFNDGQMLSCIDVSGHRLATDKSKALAASEVASVAQARQLDNPDA